MFFSPETLLVDSENVAIAIEILDKTLQGEGIHLSEEELAWEAVSYLNFLLAMNILPISLQKNVALQNHIAPLKNCWVKHLQLIFHCHIGQSLPCSSRKKQRH